MKKSDKDKYDSLFSRFTQDLVDVSFLEPREKYLYPIMRGVPFQDFHVALQMVLRGKRKVINDNRKAMQAAHKKLIKQEAEQIAQRKIQEVQKKNGKRLRKKRKT